MVDWGPNSTGWNVTIINDSSRSWAYSSSAVNNVSYAPPNIPSGTTDTGIRGKESLFGGPANMDIRYTWGGFGPTDPYQYFHIYIRSTSGGDVSVSCDSWPEPEKCVMARPFPNQPVEARIND
jgi:hypothetical protein